MSIAMMHLCSSMAAQMHFSSPAIGVGRCRSVTHCTGVANVRLTDPLGAHPTTLAVERLRAEAEWAASRGDWTAAAARLREVAEGVESPYWAVGLRGWALSQQGDLKVGCRAEGYTSSWCSGLMTSLPTFLRWGQQCWAQMPSACG